MNRPSAVSARAAVLVLACAAWPALTLAQGQAPDRAARTWAATCAACHGADGRAQGAIPALAGRDAEQIYRTLLEFRNDQRPAATVMHQHAKGYTDDELTARAFDGEGWYHTGDIGILDSDGYLTITDRKADFIIRGGKNISAAAVEEAVLKHPGIRMAAAVAMP
mgnify:CR=1 FL=1